MNHHATQVGIVLERLDEFWHHLQQRCGVLALLEHVVDGVKTYTAHNLLLVVALLLEIGHQQLSQLKGMFRTGAVTYLHDVKADILQQHLDKLSTHLVAAKAEAQRVNTLVQDVECLLVCFYWVIHLDVLADVPFVRVLLVATNKREFTWQSVRGLQVC